MQHLSRCIRNWYLRCREIGRFVNSSWIGFLMSLAGQVKQMNPASVKRLGHSNRPRATPGPQSRESPVQPGTSDGSKGSRQMRVFHAVPVVMNSED